MYIRNEDTICAPATVPGTGAISVIRVSGPQALEIVDKVVKVRHGRISDAPGYTIRFGTVYSVAGDGAGGRSTPLSEGRIEKAAEPERIYDGHSSDMAEVIDEVLVSIFRAPHSYTGEDSVEISCHASSYIVSSIMTLLYAAGARAAEPGEFTQRAFLNGKMDLAQAEAVADVIASQNAAAHRVAFRQMKGGFSSELREMRTSLLEIVSLMELELDFSEEDVEFADRLRLDSLLETVIHHISRLIDSFRLGNAIKNGVPVAIAGATNTGKSTLLNALLGEDRAIVSDVHGTTRDTIEETLNIDGVLFRFIDTAGLRETSEVVEQIGIERTFRKIAEASVVLGMVDLTRGMKSTCETINAIIGKVDFSGQKLILLLNKMDIFDVNKNVSTINTIVSLFNNKGFKVELHTSDTDSVRSAGFSADLAQTSDTEVRIVPQNTAETVVDILPISAKTGIGIPRLRALLASAHKDLLTDGSVTLVTNERHAQALSDARTSLLRVREGLLSALPTDLVAQDLREAIYHIGSIVGEISTDEVLGNIFANFCIGK